MCCFFSQLIRLLNNAFDHYNFFFIFFVELTDLKVKIITQFLLTNRSKVIHLFQSFQIQHFLTTSYEFGIISENSQSRPDHFFNFSSILRLIE